MAAKKDFSADALDAFNIELPRKPPQAPPTKTAPAKKEEKAPLSEAVLPEPAKRDDAAIKGKNKGEGLLRRTYYITRAQYRALKIRAAESESTEDKDASTIVRAAIDMYLSKGRKNGSRNG